MCRVPEHFNDGNTGITHPSLGRFLLLGVKQRSHGLNQSRLMLHAGQEVMSKLALGKRKPAARIAGFGLPPQPVQPETHKPWQEVLRDLGHCWFIEDFETWVCRRQ